MNVNVLDSYGRIAGVKSLRHSAGRHGNLPDNVVYLVSFLNPPDVQKGTQMKHMPIMFSEKILTDS